jgi:chemotaxis protein methyltransferase CheR
MEIRLAAKERQPLQDLLMEQYGFDLSLFNFSFVRRATSRYMVHHGLEKGSELLTHLTAQPKRWETYQQFLIAPGNELFREPDFWRRMRIDILPRLAEIKSVIKFWVVGLGSGEDLASLLLCLHELGISRQAQILATEMSHNALQEGRMLMFPTPKLEPSLKNYKAMATGTDTPDGLEVRSRHFELAGDVWADVNYQTHTPQLKSPWPGPFDCILCRNLLIYYHFDHLESVQKNLLAPLRESGYLALGPLEPVAENLQGRLRSYADAEGIFQKVPW